MASDMSDEFNLNLPTWLDADDSVDGRDDESLLAGTPATLGEDPLTDGGNALLGSLTSAAESERVAQAGPPPTGPPPTGHAESSLGAPAPADTRDVGPFIAILLVFVMLLAAGEIATRVWVAAVQPEQIRWYDASTQLRAEQFDEIGERSVVFAGTSMAWQGFVPSVFTANDPQGRSAYNVGLAGGVPTISEPWLHEHVVPNLEPDVVVWGLSSLDFSSSYGDTNFDAWADARESKSGRLASIERATSVSALVRWRSVLRDPAQWMGDGGDDVATDIADAQAILGGDGERLDFAPDVSPLRAAVQKTRVADMTPDVRDVAAVLRAIDQLEAAGVEVVLVQMPVPDRFIELHPEQRASINRVRDLVDGIGAETGVRVVDLTTGFTDDNFVDYTHLDSASAARLTEMLAASLSAG